MNSIIRQIDYDYNGWRKIIYTLLDQYPFLKYESIGKSVMGKQLTAIRLGNGEENVLFAGAFHGSERLTTTVILKFLEQLCFSVQNDLDISGINAKRALIGKTLWIVPVVNPDGCDIALKGESACGNDKSRISRLCGGDFEHWNANFRGIDINHNFNAGWEKVHQLERENGIYRPSPSKYGGAFYESEPETVAMVELCKRICFKFVMAFHSQGEVIYWNFDGKSGENGRKMAEIFAASSGYALDIPVGTSIGGGFKDWFIDKFNRPGFTVELGLGKNPLPPTMIDEIYEKVKEMLMLAVVM